MDKSRFPRLHFLAFMFFLGCFLYVYVQLADVNGKIDRLQSEISVLSSVVSSQNRENTDWTEFAEQRIQKALSKQNNAYLQCLNELHDCRGLPPPTPPPTRAKHTPPR